MFRGFQVFLGDATEFAVMTDRSYIMDTGRYINLDISGSLRIFLYDGSRTYDCILLKIK